MFVENFGKHQTGQANQREVAHTKILNKRLLTTPIISYYMPTKPKQKIILKADISTTRRYFIASS